MTDTLREDLLQRLDDLARAEHRSLNDFVEWADEILRNEHAEYLLSQMKQKGGSDEADSE